RPRVRSPSSAAGRAGPVAVSGGRHGRRLPEARRGDVCSWATAAPAMAAQGRPPSCLAIGTWIQARPANPAGIRADSFSADAHRAKRALALDGGGSPPVQATAGPRRPFRGAHGRDALPRDLRRYGSDGRGLLRQLPAVLRGGSQRIPAGERRALPRRGAGAEDPVAGGGGDGALPPPGALR